MPSSFTKFEVRIPQDTGNSTTQDIAIRQFLSGLATLTGSYSYSLYQQVDTSNTYTQWLLVFGLITVAQQSQALTLLNTLNTALGFNVLCYTYPVTSQP